MKRLGRTLGSLHDIQCNVVCTDTCVMLVSNTVREDTFTREDQKKIRLTMISLLIA
jgi:hypothetical protein